MWDLTHHKANSLPSGSLPITIAIVLVSSKRLSTESKICTAPIMASGIALGIYENNGFKPDSKKPAFESVNKVDLGTACDV